MATRITWNGPQVKQKLRSAASDGIVRASTFFHQKCRESVSRPNSGVSIKGRDGKSRRVYPNPSKPGEPPKLRTGFGQRNIVVEHDRPRMVSRVGVTRNARYMIFLEVGTRRIKRRPWMSATLDKYKSTLSALAGARR